MHLDFSAKPGNAGACGFIVNQLKRLNLQATTDGESVRLNCDATPQQASQALAFFEQQPDHEINFTF